jgi:formiminotetrahydrofolate cyclodeaminase
LSLSLADAEAYGQVLSARRSTTDKELRRRRVADALSMAADVPLEVAEIAWEAAAMATKLAASGNPNLRGDSLTAAALAEAAVRAAAELVRINLGDSNDPRTRRAAELEGEASALTRAAFARQ